jgi:hypothetical protein
MTPTPLAPLELLADIEELLARLSAWVARDSVWQPLRPVRGLLLKLLQRVDPLRLRMEAPLVVATFGGTGVGKSSLVNALLGEELATVGRQRPTTTQPTLIAHPETNLEPYGFPLDELTVVRRDARALRDFLILDCPDPDTSETGDPDTNLARLQRMLPHCDVLLYVSTQQKYRSAKVSTELAQAAEGCKLIFLQSHADRDVDIRADWRAQLTEQYRVADMFFIDSRQALAEQREGWRPTGDFGRLLDLLQHELSAAQRGRIRQGNLFGLVHAALEQGRAQLRPTTEQVRALQGALQSQREALTKQLSRRLEAELLASRGPWEWRLLGEISQRWGLSPFSLVLRAWHGQAGLLASWTLLRARSSVQVALWGAVQGTRWLMQQQRERQSEQQFEQTTAHHFTDAELREAQLVIEGHARTAGLERDEVTAAVAELPRAAAAAEEDFWTLARRRLDDVLATTAARHSRWPVRLLYETAFAALPAWLIYRIGKNFFYDSWWLERPLLETNFYIPAIIFLLLWTGLILTCFTARLRRGLTQRVRTLADELSRERLSAGLFPRIDAACRDYFADVARLDELAVRVSTLRDHVADTTQLGSRKPNPPA